MILPTWNDDYVFVQEDGPTKVLEKGTPKNSGKGAANKDVILCFTLANAFACNPQY